MTGLRKHGRVARPHDEHAFLLARVGPKSGPPPCFFEPPTIVGAIHIAGTTWSAKCYMNMRPLYQQQQSETEAVA